MITKKVLGEVMNYVKKMCILRQAKQGFSGDGKALSGLIKIEQYGKNLAVEVSIINFAPLVSGEYYCLLSDNKGKTEMLALRGKSLFNILSDLDISGGFCGIVCYVKNEIVPIAYGINGNGSYDWRKILDATLPPVFPVSSQQTATKTNEPTPDFNDLQEKTANEVPMYALKEENLPVYNDETVAAENYYKEKENEQIVLEQSSKNARFESANQEPTRETGADATENGDDESVLHPFERSADGYYHAVKSEIDGLFRTYPKDDTLNGAFSCSQWVRIKGTKADPEYLVGVLFVDGKAQYICYALKATDRQNPPEEIKNVCSFVPSTVFDENKGFFVIFQSAASGACVKPPEIA